jgi:hypothetical protein
MACCSVHSCLGCHCLLVQRETRTCPLCGTIGLPASRSRTSRLSGKVSHCNNTPYMLQRSLCEMQWFEQCCEWMRVVVLFFSRLFRVTQSCALAPLLVACSFQKPTQDEVSPSISFFFHLFLIASLTHACRRDGERALHPADNLAANNHELAPRTLFPIRYRHS